MYEEFDQLSSISRMSNNSETFLCKKDESKDAKVGILKRPTLEIQDDQCHEHAEFHKEEAMAYEDKREGKCSAQIVFSEELRKSTLGEIKVMNDDEYANDDDNDNDGFRTPTSLEHKIPVMTQCPPAPRKPKLPPSRSISSPSRKRKLSLIRVLDFTKEVESLFAPPTLFATISRKIKKARDDSTDH